MWWEILEVDADADLKTIKRAYAKLIKKAKPEDDSEAFIKINQAFNQAKEYHKQKAKGEQKVFKPSATKKKKMSAPIYKEAFEHNVKQEKPKKNLEDKLKEIYYATENRNNLDHWMAFIQDLNFEEEEKFDVFMGPFVETHYALESDVLMWICQKCFGEDRNEWPDKMQLLANYPPRYNFLPVEGVEDGKLIAYYELRQALYLWAMGQDIEIEETDYRENLHIAIKSGGLGLYFFLKYAYEMRFLGLSNQLDFQEIMSSAHYNDGIKELIIDIYLRDDKIDEAYALIKALVKKNEKSIQYKLKLEEIEKTYIRLQTEESDLIDLDKIRGKHRLLKFKKYPLNKIKRIKCLDKVDFSKKMYKESIITAVLIVFSMIFSTVISIKEINKLVTGFYGPGIGESMIPLVKIIFSLIVLVMLIREIRRGVEYV